MSMFTMQQPITLARLLSPPACSALNVEQQPGCSIGMELWDLVLFKDSGCFRCSLIPYVDIPL